jgi:hypothetical protein
MLEASSLATSMTYVLTQRCGLSVNKSDIYKNVAENVALFYKVNIRGEHVHDIVSKTMSNRN